MFVRNTGKLPSGKNELDDYSVSARVEFRQHMLKTLKERISGAGSGVIAALQSLEEKSPIADTAKRTVDTVESATRQIADLARLFSPLGGSQMQGAENPDESDADFMINRFNQLSNPRRKFIAEMNLHLRRGVWWIARDGTLKLKRGVDVAGAATGLVLLSPVFLSVITAIKIEDGGSIIYTSKRVGRHGKEFDFYKFRSMVEDAEKIKDRLLEKNESGGGVIFKMKNDPRITKVGKFIRRTSLDELPQLVNVLRGDMSLVGPRPPLPREVAEYKIGDRYRLEVIPGLTCLWQVSGRSELDFNQQVELDRTYIYEQTVLNDILLILKTVPAVLGGQGSY